MPTSSPTVWRRWIANEIRRRRSASGYSQAAVAAHLGCQVPKVSLIESGQRNVQDRDLEKLLELFEIPDDERESFMSAARRARGKGWWETYGEETVPQSFRRYIGLEQGAELIRSYHPAIFHGLLQTPEYTTAILVGGRLVGSQELADRVAAVRERRQRALWREVDPVHLEVIIDEAAIRRVVGSRDIMRAQFTYVLDLVERGSSVTVQVVPFDRGAGAAAAGGGFTLLSFPWPDDPGLVFIEHRAGSFYLESLTEIDTYSAIFRRLSNLALSPDESLAWLEKAARDA